MSEEVLNVEKRAKSGSQHCRRLRRSGQLPAVLYGHGEQTVSLTLKTDEMDRVLRHGAQMVQMKGGLSDQALIRDIQWDTFGTQVLHVDFLRVAKGEKIQVTVPVELRGDAPGTKEGGIVKQLEHNVELETLPSVIPERLHLNINELHLDQSLTAADIEDLPEGATLLIEPGAVLVQCVVPLEAAEPEEEVEPTGAEPELIGREEEEAEGESES